MRGVGVWEAKGGPTLHFDVFFVVGKAMSLSTVLARLGVLDNSKFDFRVSFGSSAY
jgi:hypothetical protein